MNGVRANAPREGIAAGISGVSLEPRETAARGRRVVLTPGNRWFLAVAAALFLARRLSGLHAAFAGSAEIRGSSWLAIFRHAEFSSVSRTVWAVLNGGMQVRGEVDAQTLDTLRQQLNRNGLFRFFLGRSPWLEILKRELAALKNQSARLGTIGLDLAPSAFLRYELEQQLQEGGVSKIQRDLLLRNLWENPTWTRNLSRVQALRRTGEQQGLTPLQQQIRLQRLQRRLLSALLSELQQPGASWTYDDAVLKALAVFAPGQQARIRVARPAGEPAAYWVPQMVLHHPLLRNQLINPFPVYDASGQELKPADPSVMRTMAGSA